MVNLNLRSTLNRKLTWNEMDGNWEAIQEFFQPISITYAELTAAIAASLLEPGHYYLLSDYATSHYLQYTDSHGDGTGMDEVVNTGAVEPLLLLANTNNTLALEARSAAFPQDIIHYQAIMADRNYDYAVATGKGCIIRRIDTTLNYSRDYDFRAVKFRRWETVVGNGLFRSYLPVAGATTQDQLAQQNATLIQQSAIYSPLGTGLAPYWLDNVVIQAGCSVFVMNEGLFYCTTFFTGEVFMNFIKQLFNLVFSGASFANNAVALLQNVNCYGDFTGNVIEIIDTCTLLNITYNTGHDIQDCSLTNGAGTYYSISGNVVDSIQNNTNVGDISNNVCDTIQNNANTGAIVGNVANTITSNTHNGMIGNVILTDCSTNHGAGNIVNVFGEEFTSNALAGDITDCQGALIFDCNITQTIKKHQFLGFISTKTINPTAAMQDASIPTVSRYDVGTTQHHEEILTNGVMSWSAAITA